MKKVYALILSLLLLVSIDTVYAYTKSDIIELSKDFAPCSERTKSFLVGIRSSYSRILNERDVSQENLDKIYNNMKEVKSFVESKGYCKVEQRGEITEETKNYLMSLYETTSDLLLSSPRISDGKVPDDKVVVDLNSNTFEIYEDGAVSEVIEIKEVLNHVGLNTKYIAILAVVIILLGLFSVVSYLLYKKHKRSKLVISLIFVNVFILIGLLLFRNQVSLGLDLIDKMSLNKTGTIKEVKTSGKTIVSYPSYGEKYAKIKIGDKSGDIYFGDSQRVLALGLGQSSNYDFIGEGKTVISGHNTGFFKNLFDLKENNEVTVETVYGKFEYVVKKVEIVGHTELSKLESDYDLILYTCYPEGSLYGDKRLMVYLENTSSKWVGDNSEE